MAGKVNRVFLSRMPAGDSVRTDPIRGRAIRFPLNPRCQGWATSHHIFAITSSAKR
jgi:hypothetical protein